MTERRRSFADRVYAWLLALFPREFRGDFGEQMADDFRDQRRDAPGGTAHARLWTRTAASVFRQAPREHLEVLWRDLAYAVRVLRRSPVFTLVAIATLALGIGINTAVFTVADVMLFRPLPYRNPDRVLVVRSQSLEGRTTASVPRTMFDRIRLHHSGIESAAVTSSGPGLAWPGTAQQLHSIEATPNLLDVLGGAPHLGRLFGEGDDAIEPRPAILPFELWAARFGSDPAIIGRTIVFDESTTVNRKPLFRERSIQIVGVLPRGFALPFWGTVTTSSVLFAKPLAPANTADPRDSVLAPIVRLKPGVTLEQAQAEMDVLVTEAARELPQPFTDRLFVATVQSGASDFARPFLLLLTGAAAFVLLLACVNMATLMIARSTRRAQEVGIRMAIGASRGRIVRQLIAESFVLSTAAAIAAVIVCTLSVETLAAYVPIVYRRGPAELTTRALIFTFAISAIAGLLFGAWPAAKLAGSDLNGAIREERQARKATSAAMRSGTVLITAEVALATTLLVGTGLMVNSLIRLRAVDLGFEADNATAMYVDLPRSKYPTAAACHAYHQELLHRLRGLPGVQAAGTTYQLLVNGVAGDFGFKGGPPGTAGWSVTPGSLEAMGLSIVEGRGFNASDLQPGSPSTIVDETVARHLWPDGSAVGRQLTLNDKADGVIIGVVRARRDGYGRPTRPSLFRPLAVTDFARNMTIVARTSGSTSALAEAAQTTAQQLEPGALVSKPRPLRAALREGIARTEFDTSVFVVFGVLGLIVAAIGIYGLMAFWVGSRTRELGVRLALGATAAQVHALIAWRAAVPLVAGLALGMIGAYALVRRFEGMLYSITPYDVPTHAAVALLLFAVGMAAAYVPARRAARIDPVRALRME